MEHSHDSGRLRKPIDLVTEALRTHGCAHDGGGTWTCPAHPDAKASLSVRVADDGKVLLKCHAGCDWKHVVGALGIEAQDLFPQRRNPLTEPIAVYPYHDEQGRLLHMWKDGSATVPAFVEDYAALTDGLLELHDSTAQSHWLDEAEKLYGAMRKELRDTADGAFARTGPRLV